MRRFAVTVVLSAFLLFLVQPLVGKVVLPWFGGAPAVWTTCLLFFQLVLLGGYAWSHFVVRRLEGVWQRRAHLALLFVCAAVLIITALWWGAPLVPPTSLRPEHTDAPTFELLKLLTLSVGLPYFALSSTGPLLQAWLSQRVPAATAMRLYSASNIGSLVGLLAFPIALEPIWPLRSLAWAWGAAFLLFVIFCASVAWKAPVIARDAASEAKLSAATVARWVTLAALPSALLLAMTNHLTQDVAPVPFLWVVPLVIYLASFVVTFDHARWYQRAWALPALCITGLFCAGLLLYSMEPSPLIALIGHCSFLAVACVTAHGELVRLRPAGEHLTAFYLAVSVGGAAGGLLVAIVAPALLRDFYELHLIAAALIGWVGIEVIRSTAPSRASKALLGMVALLIILFAWGALSLGDGVLERRRNFFGVLRVETLGDELGLMHGRVLHGSQFTAPEKRRVPTTYYSRTSGVGRWLSARTGRQHVGLIGLGLGTLAAYARPGDTYRFYEINPDVVAFAEGAGGFFSWLSEAGSRPEVILGDARTSLEHQAPNGYDLLVVDAFSGDSVPTHLITIEAFRLYLTHLKAEGVLALHLSNRYIRLVPVVSQLSHQLGLHSLLVSDGNEADGARATIWVLLSRDEAVLRLDAPKADTAVFSGAPAGPLWTDEFTSLWGLVEW